MPCVRTSGSSGQTAAFGLVEQVLVALTGNLEQEIRMHEHGIRCCAPGGAARIVDAPQSET